MITPFVLSALSLALSAAATDDPRKPAPAVACTSVGRIEGASDTAGLGSALDGVVEAVLVKEGDAVAAGQVVARIGAADLAASLRAAEAEVEAERQRKIRLLRGSRDEERNEAKALVDSAHGAFERAKERLDRAVRLRERGSGPLESEEVARRDVEVASAELDAAVAKRTLVEAPPLPEEIALADALIRAAEARRDAAAALVEKSLVRAPAAGTVVRRHLEPGESVSTTFPRPIVSVADLSRRRVRADVDERDVGLVRVGQTVRVTAPALGGRAIAGRVERIGAAMGRRDVRSGDPAEKSDRDVLQVIADLDPAEPPLPLGLRVTVEFEP